MAGRKDTGHKKMITCPVCAELIEEGIASCPYCHEALAFPSVSQENKPTHHHVEEKQKEKDKSLQTKDNKEVKRTSFLSHYFTNVILKQYADFSGIATRKQYWLYILFYSVILSVTSCADLLLGIDFKLYDESLGYGWLFTFASLALFVPSLAISVRRLHDIGKKWMVVSNRSCSHSRHVLATRSAMQERKCGQSAYSFNLYR